MIKPVGYFNKNNSYIDFDDSGCLSAAAYSYEIDSSGEIRLTSNQTKQLFLAMMNFYIAKNDVFWCDISDLILYINTLESMVDERQLGRLDHRPELLTR